MKYCIAVSLSFVPIIFASCTMVGPNYVVPVIETPNQWAHANEAAFSVVPSQDLSQWWSILGDDTLSSLIKESLQNSPDIHTAQAKLREARARRDLSGSNRFPTLNASFAGSRTRTSSKVGSGNSSNLFDAGFDAAWEPDVFGGLRRGQQAADADLMAASADLHNTQVSLAAEVALNYIEYRLFQQRLAIAERNLATQAETLQITVWREQAGLVTTLEVDQAKTNLEQTRATIPSLKTNLIEAENRLAILQGKAPASLNLLLAKTASLPAIPYQLAINIPAETLRQRPDVKAAEQRVIAETARIGQQTANLYPSFSLSGSFGWKALTLGSLGSAGTVASSLVASVTQTIFDAGRIRNQINIQTAVQEQAVSVYEKTVLTALEDVENTLAAYANNRERQLSLASAVVTSRSAAQLARQRFENGLVDFNVVLDTERTLLSTEDSLANTEAEGLTSLIGLYKAMGGGWKDAPIVTQAK
jgi:multidrug efflux system outer membrane protein